MASKVSPLFCLAARIASVACSRVIITAALHSKNPAWPRWRGNRERWGSCSVLRATALAFKARGREQEARSASEGTTEGSPKRKRGEDRTRREVYAPSLALRA